MNEGATWAAVIVALITAAGPGVFALVKTWRTASVTERTEQLAAEAAQRTATIDNLRKLIDDLQEQVQNERTARAEDNRVNRQAILDLRADVAIATRGVRVRDAYISLLRRHIEDRRDPPPPEWPSELLTT